MIERVLTGLSAGVLTAGILCPSHKDGGDFDLKARTGVQTSEPTTMFDHGKGSRSYTNEPHDVGKPSRLAAYARGNSYASMN